MGQYVYAATAAGGPAGGGAGLGPIIGPPAPDEEEAPGDVISVEPETAGPGASFFGISTPFYFWPWGWSPWQRRPLTLVCEKKTVDDREILVCRTPRRIGPVALAWGPPGWVW